MFGSCWCLCFIVGESVFDDVASGMQGRVSRGKKLVLVEHSRSHRLFKLIAYHSRVSHPVGMGNIL